MIGHRRANFIDHVRFPLYLSFDGAIAAFRDPIAIQQESARIAGLEPLQIWRATIGPGNREFVRYTFTNCFVILKSVFLDNYGSTCSSNIVPELLLKNRRRVTDPVFLVKGSDDYYLFL